MTKKHVSLLVVFVLLFTTLFSSFVFAADKEEWVVADEITIKVDAHVQSLGNMPTETGKGLVAFGTEGKAKRLEKFNVTLEGQPADMEIVGMAHVQSFGDMPEKGFKTGEIGTSGKAKRIEGVAFKLVKKGTDIEYPGYRVEYAVHMQSFGWGISKDVNEVVAKNFDGAEDFASNGDFAGTRGLSKRIESVSLIIYKEAKLAVKEVTANNLKTMVVNFNGAVDKDTITSTTVKVTKGSGTDVVSSRLLSEDGKTLTVVYTSGAVTQSTELKLVVDGVKSVDGTKAIEDYEKTVVVNDVTIPEVLGVSALNAKQLEISFSEPVNVSESEFYSVLSQFKVDGVSVIAKVSANYRSNSIILSLSSALEAKTHKLEVKDVTDYATYKALTKEFEFVVVEDKAAPVMTNAEMKSVNKVQVTFDEAISAIGNFWVNGQTATPTPVANSNGKKFDLTGFTTLDLGAIVQIKVEYQNQTDVVGNKVSTKTTYTFNVQDDTTLPTVTAAISAGNKLTLTFSKSMLANTGTVQILKKDGTVQSAKYNVATFKADTNDTVLELSAATLSLDDINAGTYYVNIKGMKDATVRANLLPEQKIEISALDSKKPQVVGGYTVSTGTLTSGTDHENDDTITFYFSEAMDVETAKNLSNYVLNGSTAFSAITGAAFKSIAADGKSVTITYPNAGTFVGQSFTVYALKDLAGNMLVTNTNVQKLGTSFGLSTTAVAIAVDKVELTFDNPMTSVDPSFIKVIDSDGDYAVPVTAVIGGTGSNAGKVVTFTLNRSIGTTTEGYTVVILNKTLAKDIYGQGYASTSTPATIAVFADEIRPDLDSIAQKTSGSALELVKDTFIIEFTEKVTVGGGIDNLKNDLVIKYADGSPVLAADYNLTYVGTAPTTKIQVELLTSSKLVSGTNTISVQLFADRYLKDASGNFAKVFDAETVNVTH